MKKNLSHNPEYLIANEQFLTLEDSTANLQTIIINSLFSPDMLSFSHLSTTNITHFHHAYILNTI